MSIKLLGDLETINFKVNYKYDFLISGKTKRVYKLIQETFRNGQWIIEQNNYPEIIEWDREVNNKRGEVIKYLFDFFGRNILSNKGIAMNTPNFDFWYWCDVSGCVLVEECLNDNNFIVKPFVYNILLNNGLNNELFRRTVMEAIIAKTLDTVRYYSEEDRRATSFGPLKDVYKIKEDVYNEITKGDEFSNFIQQNEYKPICIDYSTNHLGWSKLIETMPKPFMWIYKNKVYKANELYLEEEFILLAKEMELRKQKKFEKLKKIVELSEKIDGQDDTFKRESIPDDVKIYVWQRDGGKCVKCNSQENLEFDHIIPISKGGSNTARNIQLLCEKCNREKSGQII